MARVMTVLRQPAILWHDACKAESKAAFGGMATFFWLFYPTLYVQTLRPTLCTLQAIRSSKIDGQYL